MKLHYSQHPLRHGDRRTYLIGAIIIALLLAAFTGYVFWEYHDRTGRWWSHPPDSFSDR